MGGEFGGGENEPADGVIVCETGAETGFGLTVVDASGLDTGAVFVGFAAAHVAAHVGACICR